MLSVLSFINMSIFAWMKFKVKRENRQIENTHKIFYYALASFIFFSLISIGSKAKVKYSRREFNRLPLFRIYCKITKKAVTSWAKMSPGARIFVRLFQFELVNPLLFPQKLPILLILTAFFIHLPEISNINFCFILWQTFCN